MESRRLSIKYKLGEISVINPRETIKKGTIAKKVDMAVLQPFTRKIPSFELLEYKGGTKFRNGDTIMARITPCLENGKTSQVSILDDNEVGFGSTEYIVFRAKEGISDHNFLYYLICSDIVRNPAIKSMVGSSGRQRVQTDVIQNLEIDLPSLETQKQIALILSALDDKIELNNKINENLESQAQAIFCYYMENYSYQLEPLGKIANVIDCLHSKKPESIENGIYQLIQLNNIRNDGFLDMTACQYMISKEDYINWTRKCEIREGDCVITNVGRIGAVSQAPFGTKAAMGRNMTCIRLKENFNLSSYLITLMLSEHMKKQIIYNTDEGTVMGALNVKNIPKLLIPVYSFEIIMKLEALLKPIRKSIEYNNLQNQRLSKLRDTLLPKLMNGEIDVSKVKISAEINCKF